MFHVYSIYHFNTKIYMELTFGQKEGETVSKDAYYFSHDSNAHKDPKILKLRVKHGWLGYGVYWAIIETLREQAEYRWKAIDKHLLSFCFANGDDMVNQIIDTCLEVGLLIDDGEYIFSDSLYRRMKMKDEISEKRRAAGKKGGSQKSQANAKQNEANAKQNVSNKSKEKESKEKESKKKYAEYVSLLPSEYEKLVSENGEELTIIMINVLDNYKGANGKNYKSDYRAILNWVKDKVLKEQGKVTPIRYKQEIQGRDIPDDIILDKNAGEE